MGEKKKPKWKESLKEKATRRELHERNMRKLPLEKKRIWGKSMGL